MQNVSIVNQCGIRTLPPVVPIKILDSCDESLLLIGIRWETFQY